MDNNNESEIGQGCWATKHPYNFLSVDVEDWYHFMVDEPSKWDNLESRVCIGVQRILDILETFKTNATFFILGYVAEREPTLVKEITSRGHEIATHGYYHNYVYKMDQDEFKNDVLRSIKILEHLSGRKIKGFRASSFSIDERTNWVFKILEELGIEYDSSIMPAKTFYYGTNIAKKHPHFVEPGYKLIEVPPSVFSILGKRFPILGGFPLRFLTSPINQYMIKSLNGQGLRAHVYLHPWELDVNQPRMKLPPVWKFIRYYNIKNTESRLIYLLKRNLFGPIGKILKV